MDWQDKRIHLYVSICRHSRKHLWIHSQRLRSHLKIIGTYPPGPPSCEEGGNQGVLFSRYVWF